MKKLVKNWCLSSIIIFMFFIFILIVFMIIDIFSEMELLLFSMGILISSISFFFVGFFINNRLVAKVSRVNDIVKDSIPKDVLNRSLYSNSNADNEIEILCCNVENVIFEVKASEKIKNDFISSMSHELRTPLTAIKGWAETIKVGELIDFSTVRKGLNIIAKEATRLSGIVDDLLDFSVMSNGRLVLNMENIDITAEVADAVYIFREKASVKGKKLIYNDPKLPLFVYGDQARLKQVFVNVIDNALKYTKEGGSVNVNISENNDKVKIEITDNGCGIDKSEIPSITQKFYKANRSKKGFGIGLSVVKEIVSSHGGELKILSEKNIGTSVIISLDLIKILEDKKS